jgi:subtilisin family serine protease
MIATDMPLSSVREIDGVRYAGAFHPAFKLSADLYERIAAGAFDTDSSPIVLTVEVFGDRLGVMREMVRLGGEASVPHGVEDRILVSVPRQRVAAVAGIANVIAVDEHDPGEVLLDSATQTTKVRTAPRAANLLGLDGDGETIWFYDTGVDTGESATLVKDLRNRFRGEPVPDPWNDVTRGINLGGHGTHIAGITLGNGSLSGRLLTGVAPRGHGIMRTVDQPFSLTNGYNLGARLFNVSWGQQINTYAPASETVDKFTNQRTYAFVAAAAGNSGLQGERTLRSPGTSKNALTVGASGNYTVDVGGKYYLTGDPPPDGISGINANSMFIKSSSGPAPGGDRLKPDVVAPGAEIASLCRSNTAVNPVRPNCKIDDQPGRGYQGQPWYIYLAGTSQATAMTTGMGALVRQNLRNRGLANPSGMTVKALLLNGARQLTGDNVEVGYPNNVQGWGLVSLENSIAPKGAPGAAGFYDSVNDAAGPFSFDANGQTKRFKDLRFSFNRPLNASLAWFDPRDAGYTGRLVNDLDLSITAPSGSIYRGGVPSMMGGETTAGGLPDMTNSVERAIRFSPEDGPHRIEIAARTIAPGSNQLFALAASQLSGIDALRSDGKVSRVFTTGDDGVYTRLLGLSPDTDVDTYIIEYAAANAAGFEDRNAPFALHDIHEGPDNYRTDANGAYNVRSFGHGMMVENNDPPTGLSWNSPTNYIYDDQRGLGNGNYNMVTSVARDGNYRYDRDLVDYHAAVGFRVQGVTTSDDGGHAKSWYLTSAAAPAVNFRAAGLEPGANVDAYIVSFDEGVDWRTATNVALSPIKVNAASIARNPLSVTVKADGTIPKTPIWNKPGDDDVAAHGQRYHIIIDVDRNGIYDADIDVIDIVRMTALRKLISEGKVLSQSSPPSDAVVELKSFLNSRFDGVNLDLQDKHFDADTAKYLKTYIGRTEVDADVFEILDVARVAGFRLIAGEQSIAGKTFKTRNVVCVVCEVSESEIGEGARVLIRGAQEVQLKDFEIVEGSTARIDAGGSVIIRGQTKVGADSGLQVFECGRAINNGILFIAGVAYLFGPETLGVGFYVGTAVLGVGAAYLCDS